MKHAKKSIRRLAALQSQTREDTISKILALYRLERDWDGEGSDPPDWDITEAALTLARWLRADGYRPPCFITASVNATIYFEWHFLNGDYMEIEVMTPDKAERRFVAAGAKEAVITSIPIANVEIHVVESRWGLVSVIEDDGQPE